MKLNTPPQPRDQWNSPIPNYNVLTAEACKFIFEQSKAYFEETVLESEELTQRSARMLFLLLPGIAAVLAFTISNQDKLQPINNFRLMLLLSAVAAVENCVYNLFKLKSPKKIHYRGSKPEDIMRKEIVTIKDINQVEKALIISEIETYQVKSEQMEYWNYERISYIPGSYIPLTL
jgi:hypothetical protein